MQTPHWIKYIGENSEFKWETTLDAIYDISTFSKDSFTIKDTSGKLLVKASDGKMRIYKGFKWDGCTVIGKLTETPQTLVASAAHDALYIAKKNCPQLSFSLVQTDTYFKQLMKALYLADGITSVRPELYYFGIKAFGWPYKGGSVPGYIVERL